MSFFTFCTGATKKERQKYRKKEKQKVLFIRNGEEVDNEKDKKIDRHIDKERSQESFELIQRTNRETEE